MRDQRTLDIRSLCRIVALAYQSIGDFSLPSDCLCDMTPDKYRLLYQNAGGAIEYVKQAVIEQLKRDGYTPDLDVLTRDAFGVEKAETD